MPNSTNRQPEGVSRLLVPAGRSLRLDAFLVDQIPGLSRRGARGLLDQGRVRVNGRSAHKGQQVSASDCVTVEPLVQLLAAECDPPLGVLYEDPHFIAVDKPPGLPAVALRPEDRGTLGNLIVGRYPETRGVGRRLECGAVHRLDTGTSGIMLVARTEEAYRNLRRQFGTRAVGKQYLALVSGSLSGSGRISLPIAHHPRIRRRMVACRSAGRAQDLGARPALSRYRVLLSDPSASLVAISISSGVRHQVRVHMAALGHPIAGDPLYRSSASLPAPRLMLHASRIRFRHPFDGRVVLVRAAPPVDFRAGLPAFVGHALPAGRL